MRIGVKSCNHACDSHTKDIEFDVCSAGDSRQSEARLIMVTKASGLRPMESGGRSRGL